MPEFLYVLVMFAQGFIDLIGVCMSARAILSWFFESDSGFMHILYLFTEPAIMPLRKLFYKLNWFQSTPIDMAFLFTAILLAVFHMALTSLL